MDRPNENIEVAPFLDVRDSIDPISFYFEDSLRAGVTTINIQQGNACVIGGDRKSTRLNSSHPSISYAVFCLKKKKKKNKHNRKKKNSVNDNHEKGYNAT